MRLSGVNRGSTMGLVLLKIRLAGYTDLLVLDTMQLVEFARNPSSQTWNNVYSYH